MVEVDIVITDMVAMEALSRAAMVVIGAMARATEVAIEAMVDTAVAMGLWRIRWWLWRLWYKYGGGHGGYDKDYDDS